MLCIGALMISALIVAFEVGYGNLEHPIAGMLVGLIMMWGAFRLTEQMKGEKK